jgi:hypothetical protein
MVFKATFNTILVVYIPEIILKVFDYEFLRGMCDGKLGSGKSDEEQQAYRFMYSRNRGIEMGPRASSA